MKRTQYNLFNLIVPHSDMYLLNPYTNLTFSRKENVRFLIYENKILKIFLFCICKYHLFLKDLFIVILLYIGVSVI